MSTDVTTEPTAADRAKAEVLMREVYRSPLTGDPAVRDSIAAALATERATVLALPAVRDALTAQEAQRSYANDPAPTSEQLRDLVIRNRELEATVRRVEELAEELQGTAEITSGKVNGFVFAARLRDLLGIGEEA